MKKSLTDAQFKRALNLSIACTKKKWQFSTEKKIANIIGQSQNKEETIQEIEKIVQTDDEKKVLKMLDTLKKSIVSG